MRKKQDRILAKTPEAAGVLGELAELTRSFVAGGSAMWAQMSRSLPHYIDDDERDFGLDIRKRMMRDPMIRSSVNLLRMRIVENGLTLLPALQPPVRFQATQDELADYERAVEIHAFVQRAHEEMARDVEDVLFEMSGALAFGHRVAEQTLRIQRGGTDDGRLVLDSLAPKPRNNYAFVVDQANRLKGLLAAMPGISISIPIGVGIQFEELPNFMGLEKWFILTHGGENGLPTGESVLDPAYKAWWLKCQTWPQLLKYIVQFAGPSLIGYTPEDKPGLGNTGNQKSLRQLAQTPEDIMFSALQMFQSGSIVVLRGGSKVERLESTGEGKAHLATIDCLNREIVAAILGQTRATMEAAHGSRSDSDSATDILDVLVRFHGSWVQRAYRRQVLRPLVAYNFGIEAARRFTPRPQLIEVAKPDFAAEGATVAALQSSGYLAADQYPALDQRLGITVRDMGAFLEAVRAREGSARMLDSGD